MTKYSAALSNRDDIAKWREMHRVEMACQIVHDSIHDRREMAQEYKVLVDDLAVGYGSVAVGGPWQGVPIVFQFYVVPEHRARLFALFRALLDESGARQILAQSNDIVETTMLHAFGETPTAEAVLYHDVEVTSHRPVGASFREPHSNELPDVADNQLKWHGVVEVEGEAVAGGGILFHYNHPYGDIFMETKEPFRRRGFGSYLVQELKRVCYEGGYVPAARCGAENLASRKTLERAGFGPCGHILKASVRRSIISA